MRGRSLTVAGLLAAAALAWTFYKPVRFLAPGLTGLACPISSVCVDRAARTAEAVKLYEDALQFVDSVAGRIRRPPRIVFCATSSCAEAFGVGRSSARTTPLGIVVGPRGWRPHYLRHELIHHLQMERLGFWSVGPVKRWRSPEWLLEGMAYALSADPRFPLTEPFEQHRAQFRSWYRSVGSEDMWSTARQL